MLEAWNAGVNLVVGLIGLVGLVVVLGKMIQRLESQGELQGKLEERIERAEERFERHADNRNIHPDGAALDARISRMERSGWNRDRGSGD